MKTAADEPVAEDGSQVSAESILSAISLRTVLQGFREYFARLQLIATLRGRYAREKLLNEPSALRIGIATFLYGTAMSFVMYTPIIYKFGLHLGKDLYLLQFAYTQAVLILVVHLSIKLFRGRGLLRDTAIVYLIWIGIISPLILAADYPLFYYAKVDDFLNFQFTDEAVKNIPVWIFYWVTGTSIAVMVAAFMCPFRWLADLHHIGRRRVIAALIIVGFPVLALHNSFVVPYTSKGIQALADILGLV
jgi:hypothetical protein